ncbi:unnamed protein product [Lota lota]
MPPYCSQGKVELRGGRGSAEVSRWPGRSGSGLEPVRSAGTRTEVTTVRRAPGCGSAARYQALFTPKDQAAFSLTCTPLPPSSCEFMLSLQVLRTEFLSYGADSALFPVGFLKC